MTKPGKPTARKQVLTAVGNELVTSAHIIKQTGLSPKTVNTTLSALVTRVKRLERVVTPLGVRYKRAEHLGPHLEQPPPLPDFRDLDLKLAQLRSHRDALRKSGLSLVDFLIEDLIVLKTALETKKQYEIALNHESQTQNTQQQQHLQTNVRHFCFQTEESASSTKDHCRPPEESRYLILPS